jgi:hypothetical protein
MDEQDKQDVIDRYPVHPVNPCLSAAWFCPIRAGKFQFLA